MGAKRGGKTQARRGGGVNTGLVLAVGLAIGLGLAAAYLVFGDRRKLDALLPQPDPQAQAQPAPRDSEPLAQEPEAPAEASKPTYDFYTVLPEKEVELPGGSARATPPGDTAPVATANPAPARGLQLQAGAFHNAGDAEALRARLALVGHAARIETVEADGRTLHRVRLGPFASEAERNAARHALGEAGISATPAR